MRVSSSISASSQGFSVVILYNDEGFFCNAVKEKLARTTPVPNMQYRNIIPPPPDVPLKELKAIHKKILDAAAEIHPDDWK
jgi:hypothetical protein